MTIEIQVLAWNRHNTNVTGLNLVNGIPTLFYNWFFNDNTQVNK